MLEDDPVDQRLEDNPFVQRLGDDAADEMLGDDAVDGRMVDRQHPVYGWVVGNRQMRNQSLLKTCSSISSPSPSSSSLLPPPSVDHLLPPTSYRHFDRIIVRIFRDCFRFDRLRWPSDGHFAKLR